MAVRSQGVGSAGVAILVVAVVGSTSGFVGPGVLVATANANRLAGASSGLVAPIASGSASWAGTGSTISCVSCSTKASGMASVVCRPVALMVPIIYVVEPIATTRLIGTS